MENNKDEEYINRTHDQMIKLVEFSRECMKNNESDVSAGVLRILMNYISAHSQAQFCIDLENGREKLQSDWADYRAGKHL